MNILNIRDGCAAVMMAVGLAAFRKLQRNFILYL